MNAEQAIEILLENQSGARARMLDHATSHPEYDTIKRLANALEEAEKQIPKWIPCEERMPEEEGKYLVWITFPYSGFMSIKYYSQDREKVDDYEMRGKGAGFYGYGDDGNYCIEATHWMCLPEPPGKGE